MIFDSLNNYARYTKLHPGFKTGFEFLKSHPLKNLVDGKHLIDGEDIFALGMATEGKGMNAATLETHRRYIDIQYTVSGADLIGWEEQPLCKSHPDGYDTERDVEFYTNQPDLWVPVSSGRFAIFYPEDAHAPLGTDGFVHKVVIKVSLD